MSEIISIGSACVVRYNIDRFSKKKETNFFDWLITDFKTVLTILKDIDNRWFLSQDKFVQNGIWAKTHYIVDNINIRMRSIHDVVVNTHYNFQLNNFISKYNRRLDRLKNYIKGNNNLHMIHCLDHLYESEPYIVTQEDVNNFYNYINNINPNSKCFLHIVIPPKYNGINLRDLKSNKTCVYYLNYNNQESSDWWTNENYNWNIIFENIKRIDSITYRNSILNFRKQQIVNMVNSRNKPTLNNLKFT